MNKLSPKKLLNSKWTAVKPIAKQKHFLIVDVEYDDDGNVVSCVIEALMTKRQTSIQWQDLKSKDRWLMGWK